MELVTGGELIFRIGREIGKDGVVFTTYESFARDVQVGEPVLLDDGKLRLEVMETNGLNEVRCRVLNGGLLKPRKGINLPSTQVSLPCITEKDAADLAFALENDVDWIGLSFVRRASDIRELRDIIDKSGKHARIVAKIEKPEALAELDGIIECTDAVMVARGDLGVEVPMESVPMIQKDIIARCMERGRPVIVATQMMESMIENPVPTRAEVNDVANAVLDGADAVMLSAETSVGAYPVHAVLAMARIAEEMEQHDRVFYHDRAPISASEDRFVSDSMCYSACRLAKRVEAKAIVTMTFSGYTAIQVASQPHLCFHGEQVDPQPDESGMGGSGLSVYEDGEHGPHHFGHQTAALAKGKGGSWGFCGAFGQYAHRRSGDDEHAQIEQGLSRIFGG